MFVALLGNRFGGNALLQRDTGHRQRCFAVQHAPGVVLGDVGLLELTEAGMRLAELVPAFHAAALRNRALPETDGGIVVAGGTAPAAE